jgi:TetR/AcrR family transcriptional regulator, transcriptional repressor for nem operon
MTTAQTITRNKRERLIEAAKLAFYRQGFSTTSLADVAALAEVPLGNIYYYFRTKDDLVSAVIAAHLAEIRARFAQWEQDPSPRQRLLSMLQEERKGQDELARYGCPYGSLSIELGKDGTSLAPLAANLLEVQIDWAAQQFALLGTEASEARDLAVDLIAWLTGAFVLGCSSRSPALLDRQLQRLQTWVESL